MNWANWEQISAYLLPSQAFLSHVAQRQLDETVQRLQAENRLPEAAEFEEIIKEWPIIRDGFNLEEIALIQLLPARRIEKLLSQIEIDRLFEDIMLVDIFFLNPWEINEIEKTCFCKTF